MSREIKISISIQFRTQAQGSSQWPLFGWSKKVTWNEAGRSKGSSDHDSYCHRLLCPQPSCGLSTSPVTSVLWRRTCHVGKGDFFLEHLQRDKLSTFQSRWDFGFEIYGEKISSDFLFLKLRKLYRVESPKETSTTSNILPGTITYSIFKLALLRQWVSFFAGICDHFLGGLP